MTFNDHALELKFFKEMIYYKKTSTYGFTKGTVVAMSTWT